MRVSQGQSEKILAIAVPTAAAVPVSLASYPFPIGVTAVPGAGGTINIEHSRTPNAATSPGSATWVAWTAGAVAVVTEDQLEYPVAALRLTATVSAASVELTA